MSDYDVIIIGAGPAGGQCARDLARAGNKVLLSEKAADFSVNNYSSAGAPNELMEDFELPESVVATDWHKIRMFSTNEEAIWESPTRGGVVMDFKRLRAFLAEDAVEHGAELKLGHVYKTHEQLSDGTTRVWFKDDSSYQTKVLVDATGAERQILGKENHNSQFHATGIEYLVEVKPEIYQKWADALNVFMGSIWMPQGYSWIFPMEPNTLKVGVGRYFSKQTYVPHENSYNYYMEGMLTKCLGTTDVPILDKHGKTLVYTYNRKDPHVKGNIIAIGDTISMVNPLALEGIRHAMVSGRIAAKHIDKFTNNQTSNLKEFEPEIRNYIGYKWKICEFLMKKIYRAPKDTQIDGFLKSFKHFSFSEMIDLAFHYKFSKAAKFLYHYLLSKR